MADDDEEALRLNTLHRFRKHSSRLLLQEYSHCEVPAGCGGVVLRWIERERGVPAILSMAALGSIRAWMDDVELISSTMVLEAGAHVLALELIELPRANTPLVVRLDVNLARSENNATLLRSESTSRWTHTSTEPVGTWRAAGYDASANGWSRALVHSNPEPEIPQENRWPWNRLMGSTRDKLPALALLLPSTRAWLRCEFIVDAHTVAAHLAAAEANARRG